MRPDPCGPADTFDFLSTTEKEAPMPEPGNARPALEVAASGAHGALTARCDDCHDGLLLAPHTHRDPDTCAVCLAAPTCPACDGSGSVAGPAACVECWNADRVVSLATHGRLCGVCAESFRSAS